MVDLGQLLQVATGAWEACMLLCCFTIVCDCSPSTSFLPRGYHPTVDCMYHHTAETCEAAIYMCTTPSSSSGTWSTPLQKYVSSDRLPLPSVNIQPVRLTFLSSSTQLREGLGECRDTTCLLLVLAT